MEGNFDYKTKRKIIDCWNRYCDAKYGGHNKISEVRSLEDLVKECFGVESLDELEICSMAKFIRLMGKYNDESYYCQRHGEIIWLEDLDSADSPIEWESLIDYTGLKL